MASRTPARVGGFFFFGGLRGVWEKRSGARIIPPRGRSSVVERQPSKLNVGSSNLLARFDRKPFADRDLANLPACGSAASRWLEK